MPICSGELVLVESFFHTARQAFGHELSLTPRCEQLLFKHLCLAALAPANYKETILPVGYWQRRNKINDCQEANVLQISAKP